jgi:glycosyltransferase involved in cell wall biosynthesis
MRVALFLPNLAGGGAERVFAVLAEGLAAGGIETEMVLADAEGPHLAAVRATVPVIDLHAGSTRQSVLPLARYLRRRRPDVLVAALGHANVVAVWARSLARVETAVVVTHHLGLPTRSSSFGSRLWFALRARFYPWADAIVAVSQDMAVDLARSIGVDRDRIEVIHNPVIAPDLLTLGDAEVSHPWLAPGQPPVVVGIGRLERQKDFPTLVRAVGLLRHERPLRLIILGEGDERPALEALVRELGLQDDVALPGFVDNPYAFLSRAGVFALSSIYEGLPTVLIEALALGTPVVSTDCRTGPREILENGRLGRLVPIGQPQALAAAIATTLDDRPAPVPAERLRSYTQAEARASFSRGPRPCSWRIRRRRQRRPAGSCR